MGGEVTRHYGLCNLCLILKKWIIISSCSVQIIARNSLHNKFRSNIYFDNSMQWMNQMWICGYDKEKCNVDELNFHWAKNFFAFFVWLICNFTIAITKFTLQSVNCEAIIWNLSWVSDHKVCQQQRKWIKDGKPFFSHSSLALLCSSEDISI